MKNEREHHKRQIPDLLQITREAQTERRLEDCRGSARLVWKYVDSPESQRI